MNHSGMELHIKSKLELNTMTLKRLYIRQGELVAGLCFNMAKRHRSEAHPAGDDAYGFKTVWQVFGFSYFDCNSVKLQIKTLFTVETTVKRVRLDSRLTEMVKLLFSTILVP